MFVNKRMLSVGAFYYQYLMDRIYHLEPARRFSWTTMSLATALHGGIAGSFRLQVLFRTTVPMGRASASARLMPCDDPDASTTTSNACGDAEPEV